MIMALLLLLILASGCTNTQVTDNETAQHYNYSILNGTNASVSGNETINVPSNGFTFKVYGMDEFWMKENDTAEFKVIFNNEDEDELKHEYIARVFPSATDFDVMAAYQCLHFTTCDPLLSRMRLMMDQPEKPIEINYTFIGLYHMGIQIPTGTPKGTYMYNIVACKDKSFAECDETSTNFGPNVPITVHVL
jgi:hypothetical protein